MFLLPAVNAGTGSFAACRLTLADIRDRRPLTPEQ